MSKNQEHEFDLQIWTELLKIVNKTSLIPKVTFISDKFALSNRIASAYRFAIVNRFIINPDADLSRKLGRALNQVRDLRKSNNKLKESNEILTAKVNFLLAIEMVDGSSTKLLKISKSDMALDECTAVTLFGDAHVEEHVDPLVVNGMNSYNPDIAKMRIEFYFRRLIWMIDSWRRGGWKVDKLVIGILGDIINGYIHEEFEEGNFMSPTEAVIFAQELLIAGIKFIADVGKFKEIIVVCKYGNHGRTTKRKRFSTGYKNSYEYMMYTQIQKIFKDHMRGYEHVKFVIEKGEFTQIGVYDKIINFSHGDHFNYQGGIGGILVPFNRWIHKMDSIMKADKYYVAHWHGYQNIKRGVMNGSVIGYSPFAMGHAFTPESPQMHLELVDSKRGFSLNTPIILDDWK